MELSFLGWDLVNGLWMVFVHFFPILLVNSNVFPVPVLYFTYLVLVLVSFYSLSSAQVLPPFFLTFLAFLLL